MNAREQEVFNKLNSGEYFISTSTGRFLFVEYKTGKVVAKDIKMIENKPLFERLDIGEYIDDGRHFVVDKEKIKRYQSWYLK